MMCATDQSPPMRGELRLQEPLSAHTSWRVGGRAAQFYRPAEVADLAQFIAALAEDVPLFWLGLGSNVLVRDGGLPGVVICTSGGMNKLQFLEHERLRVEAGLAMPQLARQCARQGLRGTEFLCGIPGTVGGGLAMNAGALGGEIWDLVESVETVDRRGRLYLRCANEFEVAYRRVIGPLDEWFVAATLQLAAGDSVESLQQIKAHLARRNATQPTRQANAGSVFRNPPGDYAARLIEAAGLKNHCVGGACVSDKHANFIVNTGSACAADIETLIEKIEQRVKAEYGIELVREVRIIGDRHAA
ncbi:UDP-N-acetylenolpyruvoylglucosamine reductase [hydrothermal vent metagenome]|uniref:UDP-N-acetylmuramate dehydrogenase n=1 Tax=hydrothermal vent metagenome TaxID=652676 RepID=A0A3B1BJK9_9ZZZZ